MFSHFISTTYLKTDLKNQRLFSKYVHALVVKFSVHRIVLAVYFNSSVITSFFCKLANHSFFTWSTTHQRLYLKRPNLALLFLLRTLCYNYSTSHGQYSLNRSLPALDYRWHHRCNDRVLSALEN